MVLQTDLKSAQAPEWPEEGARPANRDEFTDSSGRAYTIEFNLLTGQAGKKGCIF